MKESYNQIALGQETNTKCCPLEAKFEVSVMLGAFCICITLTIISLLL